MVFSTYSCYQFADLAANAHSSPPVGEQVPTTTPQEPSAWHVAEGEPL
jgi:hypothetical protein